MRDVSVLRPVKIVCRAIWPGFLLYARNQKPPSCSVLLAISKSYSTSFRLGRICVRVVCYTDEKVQEGAAMTSLQNGKVSLGGTFL